MGDMVLVAGIAFVVGVLFTKLIVTISMNDKLMKEAEQRAKLFREVRSLRWQLCGMVITIYANYVEQINKKICVKCWEFRNECGMKITSGKISEDEVKELIVKWTKNHERWKKALRKISKLSPEKNHEVFKALEKYHELTKQCFYQLST